MFRKFALTAVATLAFGASAMADPVTFQPFGNNSVQLQIAGFDPAPGNILNVNIGSAGLQFTGAGYNPMTGLNSNAGPGFAQFTAFGQASISQALNPTVGGLPIDLPAGTNLTVVFGATERITAINGTLGGANSTVTSVLDTTGSVNYFQLFAGNTGTNNFTGMGFNNGTLILTGRLVNLVNPLVITNNNANAGDLDQFSGDSYPGIDTVGLSGNTGITVQVESFDPNYFVLGPNQTFENFIISTQFTTPYNGVDPSSAFLVNTTTTANGFAPLISGAGLGLAGVGPTAIGALNGGPPNPNGPLGVQVQGDANFGLSVITQTTSTTIPEPTTLALFAGVMGLGGLVYRRKNKATA